MLARIWKSRVEVGLLVGLLACSLVTAQTTVESLVNQTQEDVTASIWPVATSALAIFAIMVGIALIYRFIRRSISVR